MKNRHPELVDVCVITTIHSQFDARIYERSIRSLLNSGFSICLISPWKKPEYPWLKHKWTSLKAPKKRISRIFHGLQTFIAAYKQPAKVYHFHDVDFILWGVLLKFIKHVPVVYDCHDNYPEEVLYNKEWINPSLRKGLSKVLQIIEDWCVKRLHYSIVVVPNLENRFNMLGAKTVMVRNFTNNTIKRNLPHEKALIYIGSIVPAYGSDVLLEIAKELLYRNIKLPLIIVDRFPSSEIKKKFHQSISDENLNINIHPEVKPKNIDKLLTKAFIGLSTDQDFPNMRFAYHTKLFEYMAMGVFLFPQIRGKNM